MALVEFALIAVRLVLAGTFLLAGAAKLASQRSLDGLRDFGIPRVAQPLIPWLPRVEIVIALAFLFAVTSWYAAWAALVLLAIFMLGIAANLVRGRRPPCNCFGQLRPRPISGLTLVRNGVLAAGAAWLVETGPPPAATDLWVFVRSLDTHGRMVAALTAVAIGIALVFIVREEDDDTPLADIEFPSLGAVLSGQGLETLSQSPPRQREAPIVKYAAPGIVLNGDGLPVGMPAPAFELPDLNGEMHSLDALRASGKPVLLVFTSPHCESCQALVPKLPALAAQHADAFTLVLVGKGSAEQLRAKIKDPGALLVLLQKEYEVAERYNSTTSPAAVVIDVDGAIKTRLTQGPAAILELIARS